MLVSGPPTLYLVVLFAIPTLIMLLASFGNPGEEAGLAPFWVRDATGVHPDLTLESYQRFATDFIYLELFLKSLGYAVVTTLLCLLIAYPLALMIARSGDSLRDLLVLLVILPFWSNFLIRIYAWMIILGPQAAFAKLLNGLVYVHLPFMILPLYANLEKHDATLLDAAQDCGAGSWQRFLRITFPLSLPGVYAGAALVFIPAFGAFAVPDILGGTDGIMIGNLISQQFRIARDWPFGSALSMILTLAALAFAGLAVWVAGPRREPDRA
jgi:spermidine/putrescine transport system permease protein